MKENTGEQFLNRIYKDLSNSEIVNHSSNNKGDKNEKVAEYMTRLERTTSNVLKNDKINLLKKFYYDKYIIKPENVPESYFESREKIILDRGYGHIEYDEKTKKEEIKYLISEQKTSLDEWIDYFISEETSYYPMWFKYYVFQGILKLGIFNKEKISFTRRTNSTVQPFVELNREAVSFIYSELIKALGKENIEDKELEQLINNGSFSKLYSYVITKLGFVDKDDVKSKDGIWKKYNQGSNPEILFNDIHGKGTGWCTAGGIETATVHVEMGDFYVYYTKDNDGKYSNPRIAIRTEFGKIAEIRGIDKNQNLESNMEEVVKKKLEEFPDKEQYFKKVEDMKKMTSIYSKWNNGEELTQQDLRFLYEIDQNIEGFGYGKDPRISEIINSRDKREDLSKALNCYLENISFTEEEALKGNIIYHYGDLRLSDIENVKDIKLPENISGDLILNGLDNINGIILPKKLKGVLYMNQVIEIENLKFPEIIGKDLYLGSLLIAKNSIFPKEIGGDLFLPIINSVDNVIWPEKIEGDITCPMFIARLEETNDVFTMKW